jgi:predicted helicase
MKSKPDLWLYFYEDFLAAYDPKLRKDYGVYYTPREVVELQVRLASELLENRFGKKLGFADDGVVFLDPAVGTGTYPVAAVKHGLEKVRARSGPGAVPARARQMAENMHGFEVLVGPYAVAHLRLTQALEGAMNEAKAVGDPEEKLAKRLNIYLADTLESPNAAPPGGLTLTYRALTAEHEAARKVKQGGDVLVCLGNPPYDRQTIEEGDTTTQRKGGWVRFGDQVKGATKQEAQGDRAILKDFTDPATKAGAGLHLKNLYNDYVYFWRWALWRLFEKQNGGGVVTFITASSYLSGPGFVGVREVMRRTFDELWIIDLGGDNLGTRKTPNVFNIQNPVAIAVGVRAAQATPDKPAKVHYTKIDGLTRESKLTQLDAIADFKGLVWRDCPEDWHKPFLPAGKGDFFDWPLASQIFPWQHSGCELKRSWPISETVDVLSNRWDRLLAAKIEDKDKLIRKTDARHKDKSVDALLSEVKLTPIGQLKVGDKPEGVLPYSYRSFDRQFVILDGRLGDRFRPPLINSRSDKQIFLTALQSHPLGLGPGMVCVPCVPDRHVFRGSYSGKDVIPLYRDAAGTEPNVTAGLLSALGKEHGSTPSAEDLAAYVYALLGGQSYTKRFWNELETPGPRVPMTKDGAIFADAVKLGRKLIWLHTYAARFQDATQGDEVPIGKATTIKGVSSVPAKYPAEYAYDPAKCEITVGDGRFGPVAPEVWGFEVSGLKVVQSWLGYRMKKRSGKKSSPLDEIRPECWTARMSDEFLELLWVLEATLAMEADLATVLDKAVCGPCFAASDLPQPTAAERRAPGATSTAGDLLALMEDDDAADDDDEDGDDD